MTKLSLIIPALNEEKFLPRLLSSLAEQTKMDFDVVVVDGSSKDKTVEVAQSFQSKLPMLQVIVSEKASLPLQRNIGARATSGDWLAFVDADSILLPYFVERLEWFIRERKPALFTSWFRPDSEVSGDAIFTLISNLFVEGSIVFNRPIAPGPLTVVKRDVFDLVGGYNESITFFGEDYDFTQRVSAREFPLQILRETLYVLSLRRVRKEGKLRFMRQYAKASLLVLLTKRNLNNPSYIMGGQLYDSKKKQAERSTIQE